MSGPPYLPRTPVRGRVFAGVFCSMLLGLLASGAQANPYTPANDSTVLADVPAGVRHAEMATRQMARERIDVALPLAQLYIKQARNTGDLRYLGYAQAMLEPWVGPAATSADALVLHATVLQSRHDFTQALAALDRARELRPDDPQAWLTRATVLRVLGRYDQSLIACEQISLRVDPAVTELCRQSIRALQGELPTAYAAVEQLSSQSMPSEERAWRDSELGEMAVRLGRDADAERWFRNGLQSSPTDFYIRAAYADLLLRQQRSAAALALLAGKDTLEPLLLRIALAQKMSRDPALVQSRARLAAAFAAEAQRGDGIHRREEARFLLDIEGDPQAALAAARENWKVQHEVDDVLVLMRAARAARTPAAAEPARDFVRQNGIQDVRIAALMDSTT